MRRAAAALGLAAALAAAPAGARTVEYGLTEAEFEQASLAIGAPQPAAMPGRGGAELVVEGAERLDHRLTILGISCSAWQVDNPLSQMVRSALAGWDADGALEPAAGRPLLRVSLRSGSSDLRCVEAREFEPRCLVRTRIAGEATLERPGEEPVTQRFSVEDQQIHERPGACGTLSRGAALSGRAASIALIERLRAMVAAD